MSAVAAAAAASVAYVGRSASAEAVRAGFRVNPDGQRRSLTQLLAYRDIGFADLARLWPQLGDWAPEIREQIEIDAAYAGYLDRQDADVEQFRARS